MNAKLIPVALTVITAFVGACGDAEAGKRHRDCFSSGLVYCQPVQQCPPQVVFYGPNPNCNPQPFANVVNTEPQEALEPMEIEEAYTVQVPHQEEVYDPDTKTTKTVITMRAETKTRTVMTSDPNRIINSLRQDLHALQLESKKQAETVQPLTPLTGVVQKILGLVGSN
jgi:hypothetical protein